MGKGKEGEGKDAPVCHRDHRLTHPCQNRKNLVSDRRLPIIIHPLQTKSKPRDAFELMVWLSLYWQVQCLCSPCRKVLSAGRLELLCSMTLASHLCRSQETLAVIDLPFELPWLLISTVVWNFHRFPHLLRPVMIGTSFARLRWQNFRYSKCRTFYRDSRQSIPLCAKV